MKIALIAIALFLLSIFFTSLWVKLQQMRASVDIRAQAASQGLSRTQKLWLWLLGLKTPICSTFGTIFLFLSTENDSLKAFDWDAFLSHDKAVIIGFFFWAVGLWTHFSGLRQVAAMTPVTPAPAPRAGK